MARGGYREGAGRPSGSTNKSSPEQSQVGGQVLAKRAGCGQV